MGITEIASGAIILVGSLLYYRENKRHKQADTRSIDVESLTKTIKVLENERESLLNRMQSQIDDMERRMKMLQDELDTMKSILRMKDSELLVSETKILTYNRAIACRISCDTKICPIVDKIKELNG